MSPAPIAVTSREARRLALSKQHLAGPLPRRPDRGAIRAVVRDLAYIQWDPVNVVAPAHEITLWNRIGEFRASDLEHLLWRDKHLFQGWGHSASILPIEDYPIHRSIMRRYPESLSKSWGNWRAEARRWIPRHRALRRAVLRELAKGPRTTARFPDHAATRRSGRGWSSESDVSIMLFHLWLGGEVMIVGHEGRENLWGLTRTQLPASADRRELTPKEAEYRAVQRAVRSLPWMTRSDINFYFPRGRYVDLRSTIQRLLDDGVLVRGIVTDLEGREPRYLHAEDLAVLETIADDGFMPRTSLLSPFDNLTTCRTWCHRLFGFDYVHENFLPPEKRKFGAYVLPILHGDRFIGRLDPKMDREHRRLIIRSVHAEPGAADDPDAGGPAAEAIRRLAHFLGAADTEIGSRVPGAWRRALR
ncbi:MAG TPA: crosslink repair DNA glycosylase YcaQ family protein [Thermoplasmata archaeon]|nr:crosslink repair DNA glycosylase YcaQ family protein [Thermoplasmata archaeon]